MSFKGKKAILAVSFGTSYCGSGEKSIGAIEQEFSLAFPDCEVRRAFTSRMIIEKLRKRDGLKIDTVQEALEKLSEEGFDSVICQPTHVVNGRENTVMERTVREYRDKFQSILLGCPLLSSESDYRQVVKAAALEFGPFLSPGSALVFVGHGTDHFADSAYAALDYHFKAEGFRNVFVGTVEGYPPMETVISQIKKSGAQRAFLAPLMVVAGDHAVNDIFGKGSGTWMSSLEREGIPTEGIEKGLGEYPSFRSIYVEHIRRAVEKDETSA